jgi:hypothetical protein
MVQLLQESGFERELNLPEGYQIMSKIEKGNYGVTYHVINLTVGKGW